jgi:hypothetical protein
MKSQSFWKTASILTSTMLLTACISTIDQIGTSPLEAFSIELDSFDVHHIARSIAQDFDYSILREPDTSFVGKTSVEIRVYDGFGSFADLEIPIEIINSIGPTIQLLGVSNHTINVFSEWTDPGIYVQDVVEGSFSLMETHLETRNLYSDTVNPSQLGTYNLRYLIEDEFGNVSNQLTRTVQVVDRVAPVIDSPGMTILFQGTPFELDDVKVSDNYDDLTIDQLNVEWGRLNRANPSVGDYNVFLQIEDQSGNSTTLRRTYRIIHTPTSLFQLIDSLIEGNQFNQASRLFEEYKQYPQFDQSQLVQREQQFIEAEQQNFLIRYQSLKDTLATQETIDYLVEYKNFFENTFFVAELTSLINAKVTTIQQSRQHDEAVLFIHQYSNHLPDNQYRTMMRQALSFMSNAASANNYSQYRNVLERFSETIGGQAAIHYITYSQAISENAFNDFWRSGNREAAVQLLTNDRSEGHIQPREADELVRRNVTRHIDLLLEAEQTQTQISTFAQSLNYEFLTLPNNWLESYITDLFKP